MCLSGETWSAITEFRTGDPVADCAPEMRPDVGERDVTIPTHNIETGV